VDIKLLEKFLFAMMAGPAKQAVATCFDSLKADPVSALNLAGGMISSFQMKYYTSEEKEPAKMLSDVIVGILMAYTTDHPLLKEQILLPYLEQSARVRGEHVIDFFEKRAGRNANH
jgi:hypothetical protein